MRDGSELSAIEIQKHYHASAVAFLAVTGEQDEMAHDVVAHWGRVLRALETDPMSLVNEVDWITKLSVLNGYRNRDHMLWSDSRLAAIDIQFADLRPEKGISLILQQKGKVDIMFTEAQIAQAIANPPTDTRAYFRGTCISKFCNQIAAASWDSVIFDLGPDTPLKRVSTPDARGGSKLTSEALFARSDDANELLANLEPRYLSAD
jgi:proteasome accessory factor A